MMISQLNRLSLGLCLLLIALLNAQPMQAHPQYHSHGEHQYGGEGWGYSQPQRHHHGHHGGHHGHGHGYNEFNDRNPLGPNFGGYSRGGPGYGNPRIGVAYGPNYGRQQPEAGYGGQQSGSGYGEQGGFGGRPGTGYGVPTFQPRPLPTGQENTEFNNQQSGNTGNSWQARPGGDTNEQHGFQEPQGNTFQPRPHTTGNDGSSWQARPDGEPHDGQTFQPRPQTTGNDGSSWPHDGQTFQPRPRPQTSGQDTSEFNKHQSGNAWQTRPGANAYDEQNFQQPNDAQTGKTFQPRPPTSDQETSEFNNHQSGNAGNAWQTRPGGNVNDEQSFQQPNDAQTGKTFQPRPPTSDQGTSEFNNHQSGNAGNAWQTRPGGNVNDEQSFRQPNDAQTGKTFQPRPPTSDQHTTDLSHQQSGNADHAGNVYQPLPAVESNGSGEFQQPQDRQAIPTFQPRPTKDVDAESGQTFQPLPGQQQTSDGVDKLVGKTYQPLPDSNPHSAVDDNIASIFNTNNFMLPKLDDHGARDPKAQIQPLSVDGRNLFETLPQCPEGSAVRNGRCRHSA